MPASQKKKLTLFVNVVQDNVCRLIYVGNIVDVCSRWAQTKKACLNENSVNTGLYNQKNANCDLAHRRWTQVDQIDVTEEQLTNAGHSTCVRNI